MRYGEYSQRAVGNTINDSVRKSFQGKTTTTLIKSLADVRKVAKQGHNPFDLVHEFSAEASASGFTGSYRRIQFS
jgi:hypothetical protein